MRPITCPECDHTLKLSARPHQGQRVVCPGCKTNLVVVTLHPLELDTAQPVIKAKQKTAFLETSCPECDQRIRLRPTVRQGQALTCQACQVDLEVVNLKPLELDMAVPKSLHQKSNRQHKLAARTKISSAYHQKRQKDY